MTQKKQNPATVTPIARMPAAFATELVELPGWEPEQTVHFRLRRSNLRALVTAGKIPNPMLSAAQRLYEGQSSKANASFGEIVKVMTLVVDNAMVEPTYKELTEAGVELTEEQFGLIWGYANRGAQALAAFRAIPRNPDGDQDGQAVEGATQ